MATDYGNRLRAAVKHAKLTQKGLASKVGVAQGSISELMSIGHGSAYTVQFAAACGVNAHWLATGEGEMLVKHYELIAEPGHIDLPKGAFAANQNTVKKVWVVGKGQGGMAERIWTDGGYPVGITDEYAEINSSDPHAFLVRVEGSSMYPKFEEGNFALVEPETEPELEDCVLVRLKSGQTMIKRLLSRRSGYKLGSYNDPVIHEFSRDEVTWCYYIAHEVPRRRIKSRH